MRKSIFVFLAIFISTLQSCICLSADFTPLDLTPYFNNDGIAPEENPAEENFDYGGFSYALELLPKPGKISVHSIPFIFPDSN